MTIADIRATTVAVPLEAPLRHAAGAHWGRFIRTVVEVVGDDGLSGWGELGGGGESAEAAVKGLLPYLKGHDPLQLEQLRWKIMNPTASLYNNRLQIHAAIEMACLDLAGKRLGVRACDLLGGAIRDRVPFASYLFYRYVFPFQMYLIPLFFGFQWAGLLNSRLGMCLLYTAICIPFPVLVLRTYMNGLSREMDEAARMDGAREFTVFFRIVLPNVIGPMAAVFLLQFTWIWNDLLFSTILANRPETRSIMNALLVFQGSYSQQGPNIVMTGALIASIPTVVLFFLLRRHFMEGLRVS